jgi:hypothetical protein
MATETRARESAGAHGAQMAVLKPANGEALPIGELMERIIAAGDVSQLSPADRAHYMVRVAESVGLNPLSQPFDLIPGQGGKLVLYPNSKATDQLRKIYRLNARILSRDTVNGVHVVEVEVSDGVRAETNIGAVPIDGLKGEALANALMKTFTKAKRRATLDFCGLGLLEETEVASLRDAVEQPSVTARDVTWTRPGDDTVRMVDRVAEIAHLRDELGWTDNDVNRHAREHHVNIRTRSGLMAVATAFSSYVSTPDEQSAVDDDEDVIDADFGPPGQAGDDGFTR